MKKFLATLMNMMMLSCRRVTEFSCTEERKGMINAIRYRIHLFICHKCKVYAQQIEMIRQNVKKALTKEVDPQDVEKIEKEVLEKMKANGNEPSSH